MSLGVSFTITTSLHVLAHQDWAHSGSSESGEGRGQRQSNAR